MDIEHIIIHHTAVSRQLNSQQYEAVREYHKKQGWGYIGYHYFIEPNGLLMKGRQENVTGAHCKEDRMNYRSLGVCLAGNFDKEKPTDLQVESLKDIIAHLRIKYKISRKNVKFHRHFTAHKSCPGYNFTQILLNKCMPLLELKRDQKGGFWFVKKGDDGKQAISTADSGVAGLITVLSREFGVDTMPDSYFDKLENRKYFG